MSSSSWFERNKKVAIGVGVAAVVGAVAVGAYYLNKKPSRVSSSSSDAQSHASLAMKHHKNGSHRESIQSWTDAIRVDPNNFKYYNNRAQSYMLVNEYELALADAEKAITLNGEAAGGYYNRGRAAMKLERFEDAAAAFTAALRQVDASKIANQAQGMLKTCEEKIKKIRDSRFPSVAGAKKSSPVNSQRVSPSNKVSPTTSPVAAKKHTEQVAHVASTILEHAKPPVVEPVKATLPTPAAAAATVTRTPSPAPAPAPAQAPATTTTPSPIPSSTQPDLSSTSKIAEFLTEQRRIQAEIDQKQKAVEVADKIVDKVTHYVHTTATTTTTSSPAVSTASSASASAAAPSNSTSTNTSTAPVQIPSIFTPTSQNNKAESPVSPVSDTGSNSGIFERSAVYVPNDGSAQTPPNKQSRLSFMTPDLISDTTTIDAGESWDSLSPMRPRPLTVHHDEDRHLDSDSDDDPLHSFAYQHAVNLANQRTPQSAVPIEAFAAIATGTPLETPPSVFRTISAENSASSSSNSTSASKSTSITSSPILLNKPLPKAAAPATVPNGPLNFASENPLDEM